MAGPWERYGANARQMLDHQGAAMRDQVVPQKAGPWQRYSAAPDEPELGLDYNSPNVRREIEALPEGNKKRAYDIWADKTVAAERAAGMKRLPSVAEGIPIIGGFLDEATAAIQSGLNSVSGGRIGEPYDAALALERARSRAADAANPALAMTSKLAAGVATGGPLFSRLPVAPTLAGRVQQGAVVGGATGLVEGYSRGEGDVGDRMRSAGEGLGTGAAIGAVLPGLAAGASRVYGAAADRISPAITRMRQGPEQAADEILARRITAEGATPGQKRLELQEGQQQARLNSNSTATLPETIADTSDDMQRLAGSVYRAGGEAGNYVRQTLQRRQAGPDNPYGRNQTQGPDGQRARIMDSAERAMLIRSSDTARRTERQIMAEQARDGRRLYQQAYESAENFDLSTPITAMGLRIQQYPAPFAARLQRAINLFTVSGTRGNRPFYVDNIRRFDSSKKALDDMIDTAQRQGQNNLVRELTQFKDELLRVAHAADDAGRPTRNLVYHEARQTWGTAAENREAIELGRQALREGAEISAEQFRELSRGQQQLFRIGFLESLRSALGKTRPGQDATMLFQQPRVQELMNEIIPASRGQGVFSNRPERFGDVMRREQRMVSTRNAVLGGSQTAQRQGDDIAYTGDALRGMWDRFRQSPSLFNMGVEAIGSGIQRVFGYRQDVALALARRLLETDRTAQNQILRRLQRRAGPDRFVQFADLVDRSAVTISGTATPALLEEGRAR